jgi:tetratricopeptide (TPR) repeat protein
MKVMNEEQQTPDTEYYEDTETPLKSKYYKIAEAHLNSEDGNIQQPEDANDIQWGSQVNDYQESENKGPLSSDMDESQEEMIQSLESLKEGAGDLDPEAVEECVSEIESDLLDLEKETHNKDGKFDSGENYETSLDEFEERIYEAPQDIEEPERENIQIEQEVDLSVSQEEETPEKDEPGSYGDLGGNLDELERLLIEKTENTEFSEEELQREDQQPDNNVPVEDQPLVGNPEQGGPMEGEPKVANPEEGEHGLEELESNLDELQDLLVTDSAHLDGQKIVTKHSGATHLDGHQLTDSEELIGMDAHSSDYKPPVKNQPSLDTLMNQGRIHMERGEFKEAMNCFDMALEIDPQYVDAWGAKGDLLL